MSSANNTSSTVMKYKTDTARYNIIKLKMALTIHGYRIPKPENAHHIKGVLTVKPYVPSVFVKPQFVPRYKVFQESTDHLYIPKHYGIQQLSLIHISEPTRPY